MTEDDNDFLGDAEVSRMLAEIHRERVEAIQDAPHCEHLSLPLPEFDAEAAAGLSADAVQQRWPRGYQFCPDCQSHVILYASMEHYLAGDW